MGDMLTLIEQAEQAFDAEEAEKAAAKLQGKGGDFTLEDFLTQMQAVRKLGSMSKIMAMIPGMSQYREQLDNFDEREVDRIQALILSMTPAERDNPKIIDGSRRARIAKGSGRSVSDVNELVDRFFTARTMMRSMASGGGMPGLPGVPGAGAGKRSNAKQAPQRGRKKRASGNPAKRAAQEAAARAGTASGGSSGAAAFGFDQPAGQPSPADVEGFELPKELRDLL
jgi:signal recognition particle subunit SRP54